MAIEREREREGNTWRATKGRVRVRGGLPIKSPIWSLRSSEQKISFRRIYNCSVMTEVTTKSKSPRFLCLASNKTPVFLFIFLNRVGVGARGCM